MNSFDELCKKLTQDVANNIVLKRSWKDDEQLCCAWFKAYFS